jgi:hypothetical protein
MNLTPIKVHFDQRYLGTARKSESGAILIADYSQLLE